MNILCPDLELVKLLNEANKNNNAFFSANYINAPDQNDYNHVDYILKCASLMIDFDCTKTVFCFRYYTVASSEWKYQKILESEFTDFHEVLLFIIYGTDCVVVGKKYLMCQVIDNKQHYEIWDFDLMHHETDPYSLDVIGSYSYDKYMYQEPEYVIPNQLVPNMA